MIVFLIKAAQLILAFAILVFVHELGHYFFARLFRVRVDKFYLFFDWGGAIFRYKPKRSETEFGIGWLWFEFIGANAWARWQRVDARKRPYH